MQCGVVTYLAEPKSGTAHIVALICLQKLLIQARGPTRGMLTGSTICSIRSGLKDARLEPSGGSLLPLAPTRRASVAESLLKVWNEPVRYCKQLVKHKPKSLTGAGCCCWRKDATNSTTPYELTPARLTQLQCTDIMRSTDRRRRRHSGRWPAGSFSSSVRVDGATASPGTMPISHSILLQIFIAWTSWVTNATEETPL